MQASSEVFFRKVNFWDKGGQDAPPVFNVDGVSYLYVKVPFNTLAQCLSFSTAESACPRTRALSVLGMHGATARPPPQPCTSASQQCMHGAAAQDGGVFLVATTRENVSPSLVLELLRRIGGIIKVCSMFRLSDGHDCAGPGKLSVIATCCWRQQHAGRLLLSRMLE